MAGIGFELKKLFRRDGILSTIVGGAYATVVTVGPTIMVIIALNLMYMLLPYADVGYRAKELLSATILYVFIFALLLSGPFNILLSRYIADMVFEERYEMISSAIEYGGFGVAIGVAVLGIPFGFRMYYVGHFSITYILMSYMFFAGLTFSFYLMTFVTLLKEYRKIAGIFFVGLALGIISAIMVNTFIGISPTKAILFGLMLGFNLIAVFLFVVIRRTFPDHKGEPKELFLYTKKNMKLVAANFLYLLGLYIHNFVFWAKSEYRIEISNVFVCASVYDEATYLGMLSCISFLVIFVVNVETKFHTAYQNYCQAIIGAGGEDIDKCKEKMIRVLREELVHIIQIQFVVIIIVFLAAMIIIPRMGMDGSIMAIFPVLSVGYFLIYLVQGMMIFLFYLDDEPGALLTGALFAVGIFVGSMVSVHWSPELCGMGVVFGGAVGFTFVYFRLRYMLIHLDEHIFCRGSIINKVKTTEEHPNEGIYPKRKEKAP